MDKFSYLSNADVNAIEDIYEQFKQNPENVEVGWRKFFEGFEFSQKHFPQNQTSDVPENVQKEFKVINLINDYRSRGHLFTKTNPVRTRRTYSPTLEIENYGLSKADLETIFNAGEEIGLKNAKLKDIIQHLDETYCTSIGVEYAYIRNPEVLKWLRDKIEPNKNSTQFSLEEKKQILRKINQAVVFENFMHKKFVGQKRFSLEGGESLIPALDTVIEKGAKIGIEEFVVGMAHRGRLNVLANIFNKTYRDIFSEFEGKEYEDNLFDGDVKYHLGYTSTVTTNDGEQQVKLTLSPNPSHLEAVDPVVEGIVRAKIDQYLKDESKICPILIHGDASIAGQGVVYEVIQMSKLNGYRTGGTVHIVINNQLGFTTNYIDGRSSIYCTDVGKVTLSPVFHVNGDDVEAVVHAVTLAMEFRQRFHQDVFIDLLCYRKYGHNEGDEPRFTQPVLYKAIAKHPNPREIYLKQLLDKGVVTKEEANSMEEDFKALLQERLDESKEIEKAVITPFLEETWEGMKFSNPSDFDKSPTTAVSVKKLKELAEKITHLPEDKKFFKKIQKLFNDRKQMIEDNRLDWGMAELLAYATILDEGKKVRISGQDVERGTFSHRHAVVTLEDSEERYVPLANISEKQGDFYIYNSLLSEYGVLGFDYGYAMASPNALTIWEAQFGDFNNGAQIIIDQFLSSAEDKWRAMNGLVMLLPHGYEGQGSEHSSARMERFLNLCAEENIQVLNCTTPGNFFHALRRQLAWPFRKPLVVFTPKSLLRHPKCVSSLEDLSKGGFQEIIDDSHVKVEEVDTVVFLNGKFYYDLLEEREKRGVKDIAFVRMEQLYPIPRKQIQAIVKRYKNCKNWVWAQEEPRNMGAWSYILRNIGEIDWKVIGRYDSASPATGSSQRHIQRHTRIINQVFNKDFNEKRY